MRIKLLTGKHSAEPEIRKGLSMKLEELLTPELYAQVKAEIDKANAGQSDKTKHIRFADLSEGGYVSVDKFNSQVNTLTAQVKDLQGQIAQRDSDISGLQEKLTAAQADASKLGDVQNELKGLQTKYENDQKDWAAKTAKQQKEFTIREKASELKFTSKAAKRDFISQALGKDLGENLVGFDAFLDSYKTENDGAFVVETPPADPPADPKKPTIVKPTNPTPPKTKGKSLMEMMAAKNANPDMVVSFDK